MTQNSVFKASSSFSLSSAVSNVLWGMEVIPKIKSFWWKKCVNALVTKENLCLRNCGWSPLCPRCKVEVESIEHVLFRCSLAINVWFRFPVVDCSGFSNIVSMLKWFNDLIVENLWVSDIGKILQLMACVGWCIWKARNSLIF